MREDAALLVSAGTSQKALERLISSTGFRCVHPQDAAARDAVVGVADPEAMSLDVQQLCGELRGRFPGLAVVVVGEFSMPEALRALRAGAADYLDRSTPPRQFAAALERARALGAARRWHSHREPSEEERRSELSG